MGDLGILVEYINVIILQYDETFHIQLLGLKFEDWMSNWNICINVVVIIPTYAILHVYATIQLEQPYYNFGLGLDPYFVLDFWVWIQIMCISLL